VTLRINLGITFVDALPEFSVPPAPVPHVDTKVPKN